MEAERLRLLPGEVWEMYRAHAEEFHLMWAYQRVKAEMEEYQRQQAQKPKGRHG